MKRVFIIHGWGGSPEGACLPWLKKELSMKGFKVIAPQMPNTENPTTKEWIGYLSDLVGEPDEQTYFIGHSIGCQAIMRYLESAGKKVGGVLLIAAWIALENLDEEEKEIAKPWIEISIDFKKIEKLSRKYFVLISDDDPFGGFEKNKNAFEAELNAEVVVLKNAGHIEQTELPIALEKILDMAN